MKRQDLEHQHNIKGEEQCWRTDTMRHQDVL